MTHDMFYDGRTLHWPGHGNFRATSGMPGSQYAGESSTPDAGPVPPGLYKVDLTDQGAAQDGGRARLEPADLATRNRCSSARGEFYLHDSIKGFSHGCIEVEGRIFPLLRTYARDGRGRSSMLIKVEYVADREINGGTLVE